MKVLRFGNTEFDSDTHSNKKEAVPNYETASFSFYSLQILLDSVHWCDPVQGFEGQVEGILPLEPGALRYALYGGGQVRTFVREIGRMPDGQLFR